MPNTVLTVENITAEIMTALGDSAIDVELEESDFTKCIRDAVRTYSRVVPMRRRNALAISVAQKKYELALAEHPGILGVVDVQFSTESVVDTRLDPFSYEDMSVAGLTAMGGETFGELVQRKTYTKDAQRVVSAEPEWTESWEADGRYYLYVDVTNAQTKCTYWWTADFSPDDNVLTGMQWIPNGDTQWILDFVLARAKQILARILGKFQGIVTPDGGVDSVDFTELKQEGREDEQSLKEDLEQRRRTLPPNIG